MDSLITFLTNFAESVWGMLVDSAFLLLVGIILAGVIHTFLSEKNLARLLKGSPRVAVIKAAVLGVPLPLCSCSVLPVAHELRSSGLNRGGTAAFLISTPETGVDSILLTYSLMDPLMTVARPVTAFLTAMGAGLFVNGAKEPEPIPVANPAPACESCCSHETAAPVAANKTFGSKLIEAFRYGFGTLLSDLSPYLVTGYLLAGLVALLVGDGIAGIPDYLLSGWGSYAGAIVVGLPLYICATSSTPLAAVLLGAGFSPGAILVFLLVGPATNVASLTVVKKILGVPSLVRYLIMIVIISIVCGLAVDAIYSVANYDPVYRQGEHHGATGLVAVVSAAVFSVLVVYLALRKLVRRLR